MCLVSKKKKKSYTYAVTAEETACVRTYLAVDVCGPEPCHGMFVGVGWENRRAGGTKDFVNVLQDDERLADRDAVVDENGQLFVHRVGPDRK